MFLFTEWDIEFVLRRAEFPPGSPVAWALLCAWILLSLNHKPSEVAYCICLRERYSESFAKAVSDTAAQRKAGQNWSACENTRNWKNAVLETKTHEMKRRVCSACISHQVVKFSKKKKKMDGGRVCSHGVHSLHECICSSIFSVSPKAPASLGPSK